MTAEAERGARKGFKVSARAIGALSFQVHGPLVSLRDLMTLIEDEPSVQRKPRRGAIQLGDAAATPEHCPALVPAMSFTAPVMQSRRCLVPNVLRLYRSRVPPKSGLNL